MKLKEKLRPSADYEQAVEYYAKKIVQFGGGGEELMNAVVAREALTILAAVARVKEMGSGKEEEIELE